MNDDLARLSEAADESRSGIEYRLQMAVLELSERVHVRLKQLGITQAELARRMSVSRPMITKLLTGDSNFQLRTLMRLAEALNMELVVDLVPEGFRLPHFYVSHEVGELRAYTESTVTMLDSRALSSKKQIHVASGSRSTSEYTVGSPMKVA